MKGSWRMSLGVAAFMAGSLFIGMSWGESQAGAPQEYQYFPPDDAAWAIMQKEVFVDYFFKHYILKNPQRLPQSEGNPLGYKTGTPWDSEFKRSRKLIPELDVVGPDGVVYPNVSYAGVQGGIPKNLPIRAIIEKDNGDFARQLEDAIEKTRGSGGGVVEIKAGNYVLKRPVRVTDDNIVIRGAGAQEKGTKIDFAYGFKGKDILWIGDALPTIARMGELGIMAMLHEGSGAEEVPAPYGEIVLQIDGKDFKKVSSEALKRYWLLVATGVLTCKVTGKELAEGGIADGKHLATAVVKWRDGTVTTEKREFVLDSTNTKQDFALRGAIEFRGRGIVKTTPLGTPLKRGTTQLSGVDSLKLQQGDFVRIYVNSSGAWQDKRSIPHEGRPSYDIPKLEREGIFQIKEVKSDGSVVLNQPLRFSIDEGEETRAEKLAMLQGCGIEGVSVESSIPNVLMGVYICYAANCWAIDLNFKKPGYAGLWGRDNKWVEVRNVTVDDGWFKGGGMAYIGWEFAFDCLMDGVKGRALRHAPNFQFSCSGCVVRNGDFTDSDGQLHAGWPHENLIENCTIRANRSNGGYGFGFLFPIATGKHYPAGPRNVLYNNDINAEEMPGIFLGGSCEASLFMYNRIYSRRGPAVYIQFGSFDHTFIGNYFVTENPVPGAVYISTPDCTGNEFKNNRFVFGQGVVDVEKRNLFSGAIPPSVSVSNKYVKQDISLRPQPAVKSIYEWQVEHVRQK